MRAREPHAVRKPQLTRRGLKPPAFWPFTDDQQPPALKSGQGGDRQLVALARDQVPNREQGRSVKPELLPSLRAIRGPEKLEIDAVAQHGDVVRRSAKLDHCLFQPVADRDQRLPLPA